VGDLVAAQGREGHPHFDAGASLARGETDHGPRALAATLVGLARAHRVEMPLTEALLAIYEGLPPVEAVQMLMARPAAVEHR